MTSIIYLYNENMNLEMTIKKLGSAYKFRVGRATGNEHIFCLALAYTNVQIPCNESQILKIESGPTESMSLIQIAELDSHTDKSYNF